MRISHVTWAAVSVWTLVLAGSLYAGVHREYVNAEAQAKQVARSSLDKDFAFRQWVSKRGGLYGKVGPLLPENPYLSHMSGRNIETQVGRLTLLDPASILRMLMEDYATLYGIKGRIVGLKALNPVNLADDWERKTINRFSGNRKLAEYSEIAEHGGKPYMRMMTPMYIGQDCLKCHASSGYQLGELAGGVNVSVPLAGYYARAMDGGIQHAQWHIAIWLIGLAGIMYISRRVLSNERQREGYINELRLAAHIYEDGLQGVVITDEHGKIERVNKKFCEITGYSAEEVKGKKTNILNSGHHSASFFQKFWSDLAKNNFWQGELINRRKDGEEFCAWESIIAMRDKKGEVKHYISLFEDITARKAAENSLIKINEELESRVLERTSELEVAKSEAEKANQAKSEFLSQMSHELRTPLNAMLGFGHLLKEDRKYFSDDHVECIDEIVKAGQHLLVLINDVLDLAKVDTGKMSMSIEPCLVGAVVGEAVSLIQPMCDKQGVSLQVQDDLGGATTICCDRVRLKQVLLNLLSNAVKYNRDRGSVHVNLVNKDAHAIRIGVTDTGHGLSQEDLTHLFNPFERLPQHMHIEGNGIGLALSYKMIGQMGATLGVESELGVGTTFWIDFPRPEMSCDIERGGESSRVGVELAADQGFRVLYIEDNMANIRLMANILKDTGIELLEAQVPSQGLRLAVDARPDLILLDIKMPEMSGYEVLDRLKAMEETRNIPVIAISANAMPDDVDRGGRAAFSAYLTKPLDIDMFRRELGKHIKL